MKRLIKTGMILAGLVGSLWAYNPPWGYIWARGQTCNFDTHIMTTNCTGRVTYTRTSDNRQWSTTDISLNDDGKLTYKFSTDNCPPANYTYRITAMLCGGDRVCERTVYIGPGTGSRFDLILYPSSPKGPER